MVYCTIRVMSEVPKISRSISKAEQNLFFLIQGEETERGLDRQRDINGLRNYLLNRRSSRNTFDINCINYYGFTPLMCAIGAFGHDEMQDEFGNYEFRVSDEEERSILEVVTILLEHGADVNMKKIEGDWKGFTALHMASRYSSKIVQLLLCHGANPNVISNEGNITPMCIASRRLNHHTLKALLEFGADVNHKDEEGLPPIHKIFNDLAPCRLHLAGPALKVLIEYGADVDMHNKNASTPLHILIGRACRWESAKDNDENYYGQKTDLAVIQQLLDAGADVNKGCDVGDTPLHDAVNYLSTNLMKLLLKYNPKLSCNIYDETPLHWALKHTRDRLPISLTKSLNEITDLLQAEMRNITFKFLTNQWSSGKISPWCTGPKILKRKFDPENMTDEDWYEHFCS